MIAKGKVLNWGNSMGIRLSKPVAESAGLQQNEEIEFEKAGKLASVSAAKIVSQYRNQCPRPQPQPSPVSCRGAWQPSAPPCRPSHEAHC